MPGASSRVSSSRTLMSSGPTRSATWPPRCWRAQTRADTSDGGSGVTWYVSCVLLPREKSIRRPAPAWSMGPGSYRSCGTSPRRARTRRPPPCPSSGTAGARGRSGGSRRVPDSGAVLRTCGSPWGRRTIPAPTPLAKISPLGYSFGTNERADVVKLVYTPA